MARVYQWIGLAALSLALTGCVTQEKYAALKLERDQLADRLGASEKATATALSESEIYKQQLAAIRNSGDSKEAMILNLTQENADLKKQIDDANRKYADAMGKFGQIGTALPVALTNELSAFAAQNPDLVDFDASRGVVKFKSDVTFSSGSAEVTDRAKEVIARFSTILNSATASSYELLVAGHTDSSPVANPATIAAGHKNNWYLSAHRAIGVAAQLVGHGVGGNRLGVVGYAEQRPVASNATDSGKAMNRRVEVLILPSSVRSGPVSATPIAVPTKAVAKPVLNKDASSGDGKSAPMNK